MAKNEINFTVKTLNSTNAVGAYHDTDKLAYGLYLRIKNIGGAKAFKVFGRVNGKQVEVSLGLYPNVTIQQARHKARDAQSDFANGINPNLKKKFERTKQATLADTFQRYLEVKKLQPKTIIGYHTSFKNVLHPLSKKAMTDITFNDVLKVHKDYAKRSTAEADRAMRLLRAIFYMAMDEVRDLNGQPLILENPVRKLGKNKHFTHLDRKTRKVEDDQIKQFLDCIEAMTEDNRPFYQVGADLILTLFYHGTRFTETANIKWVQVDLKRKHFYLTETKNGRRLWLPMTTESEKLFKRRKSLATGSEFVFPSATNINKPLSDVKKPLRHLLEQTGIEITPHDLRRTFESTGNRIGLSIYTLKQLANHTQSKTDVTQGYTFQNADELREPSQKITNSYLEKAGRAITDTDGELKQILNGLSDSEKQRFMLYIKNMKKAQ